MNKALQKEVKQSLEEKKSIELIVIELANKGYLEEDIKDAIDTETGFLQQGLSAEKKEKTKLFFFKELLDRLGYGFGSRQYVNILFFHTGASLFLIGLINSITAFIGTFVSSVLKEYSKENFMSHKAIGFFGILFGFCFIIMAIARFFGMTWLFAFAMILGTIGIVHYGEFYKKLFSDAFKGEKRGSIKKVYKYGLLITGSTLLIAGYILDRFPMIKIGTIEISGYLIVFEIAAIMFILSGYILTKIVKENPGKDSLKKITEFSKTHFARLRRDVGEIFEQKVMWVMLVAATITGVVQIVGSSFYGIFIYENFKYVGFGGFLNVAMISFIAIATALLTPIITRNNIKEYGKFPMLVFGTILIAITPLTFYYNPNLVSITIGTLLGVMGGAIVGISHGFLAMELLPQKLRDSYFNISSVFITIPYFIAVPAGGYLGQTVGLRKLFLALGIMLIVIVVPLYFIVVVIEEIKHRKRLRREKSGSL